MPATVTYRMLKIQDPRSPGFFWYEIECRTPAGETHTVAVCDTRDEARETIAVVRAAVR
jgi:multisubunit Na+/H+ antiporter MnhE subunit